MQVLEALCESVQKGKSKDTAELAAKALAEGVAPETILDEALIKAMEIVGEKYKNGEIFVPEMLIAARALNKALEILEPEMLKASVKAKGTILLGTVKGDLHDIGKNLVGIMFKGSGFNVIDLGTDVAVETFVAAAIEHRPDIIGLSSLLTTTMNYMQLIIEGVRKNGILSKVIVGGAPVTSEFAAKINADGYADNAASAVDLGKSLLRTA
jgi:5-methyltetrahydrofolate--homocysteine methyltransferase